MKFVKNIILEAEVFLKSNDLKMYMYLSLCVKYKKSDFAICVGIKIIV